MRDKKQHAKYSREYYKLHKEACLAYRRKYYIKNKDKLKKAHHQYYQNHRQEKKEYAKQYASKHPEKKSEYQKRYYRNHIKEIKEYQQQYAILHPDKVRAARIKVNITRRILVFNHYGHHCVCCGETEPKFLAIDHILGGGNKHIKEIGRGNLYRWIIRNKYPKGFQVLCHNCNVAKGFYGSCPHQDRNRK